MEKLNSYVKNIGITIMFTLFILCIFSPSNYAVTVRHVLQGTNTDLRTYEEIKQGGLLDFLIPAPEWNGTFGQLAETVSNTGAYSGKKIKAVSADMRVKLRASVQGGISNGTRTLNFTLNQKISDAYNSFNGTGINVSTPESAEMITIYYQLEQTTANTLKLYIDYIVSTGPHYHSTDPGCALYTNTSKILSTSSQTLSVGTHRIDVYNRTDLDGYPSNTYIGAAGSKDLHFTLIGSDSTKVLNKSKYTHTIILDSAGKVTVIEPEEYTIFRKANEGTTYPMQKTYTLTQLGGELHLVVERQVGSDYEEPNRPSQPDVKPDKPYIPPIPPEPDIQDGKDSETKTNFKLEHLDPFAQAKIRADDIGNEKYNNLLVGNKYFGIPTSETQWGYLGVTFNMYSLAYQKVEGVKYYDVNVTVEYSYPYTETVDGKEVQKTGTYFVQRVYQYERNYVYYTVTAYDAYQLIKADIVNKTLTEAGRVTMFEGNLELLNGVNRPDKHLTLTLNGNTSANTNNMNIRLTRKAIDKVDARLQAANELGVIASSLGTNGDIKNKSATNQEILTKKNNNSSNTIWKEASDKTVLTVENDEIYHGKHYYDNGAVDTVYLMELGTTSTNDKEYIAHATSPQETAYKQNVLHSTKTGINVPTNVSNNIYDSIIEAYYRKAEDNSISDIRNAGVTSLNQPPAFLQKVETTQNNNLQIYKMVSNNVNSVVVHTPVYIKENGITGIKETQVIYSVNNGQEPIKDKQITTEITTNRYIADKDAKDITLKSVIRDFKADGRLFEDSSYNDGLTLGLVGKTLGTDKTPTYNLSVWKTLQRDNGITQNDVDSFYHNVSGKNIAVEYNIVLKNDGTGKYTYSSNAFFPIDGKGFGNEGRNHNFHFTTQMSSIFKYTGEEYFTFTGDDDVWVFIGNTLALDIGGTHGAQTKTIKVADHIKNNGLNIKVGDIVTFDFFHMERHTDGSNLNIVTNMNFITQVADKVTAKKPIYELELDGEYTIDLETIGIHRDTLGYSQNGNKKDYSEWGNYEISFPFDVYKIEENKKNKNKTYKIYKAGKWIPIDEEKVENNTQYKLNFKIPVWANEGDYYITEASSNYDLLSNAIVLRVKAENDPNTSESELGRYNSNFNNDYPQKNNVNNDNELYNKDSYDHRAFEYINCKVVGKLGGFKFDYTDDEGFMYMMQSGFTGLNVQQLPFGQKDENIFNKNYNYGLKLGYKFKFTLTTKGEKNSEVQIVPNAYFVTKNGKYTSRITGMTYQQGELIPIDIYYQADGATFEKMNENSMAQVTTMITKPGELPYIPSYDIDITKKVHQAFINGTLITKYAPIYNLANNNFNIVRRIGNVGMLTLNEYVRLRDNKVAEYVLNREYGAKTEQQILQDASGELNFTKAISKWYGEFYLPSTTRIVERGQALYNQYGKMQNINIREDTDGYIIVFFEIRTLDANGNHYLSYQLPNNEIANKWLQEGYATEETFITLPNVNSTKLDKGVVTSNKDIGAAIAIYEAFITKDGNVVGKN